MILHLLIPKSVLVAALISFAVLILRKELADMYGKQIDGLRDQITALKNRPVEVHHHHKSGCSVM